MRLLPVREPTSSRSIAIVRCVLSGSKLFAYALGARAKLNSGDYAALLDIPVRRETIAHRDVVFEAGEERGDLCVLVSGIAVREHQFPGQCAVSSILVPGDLFNLHSLVCLPAAQTVRGQGCCLIERVCSDSLTSAAKDHPNVARALSVAIVADARLSERWTVVAAALNAEERVGHLVCELHFRLSRVGLVDEGRFRFPMDQTEFAMVLGVSVSHFNRVVQKLRSRGLIEFYPGLVRVPNPERLAVASRFDGSYLNTRIG